MTKGIGMEANQIKDRLAELQSEMDSLTELRRNSAISRAISISTDELAGINLDELSKWAREMKMLNTQIERLANERRELRATRRELRTCECDCHHN